jgi:hypothetical protein
VHHQPAALDRQVETGFVFGRRLRENRIGPLIFLDMDPAVLRDFDVLAIPAAYGLLFGIGGVGQVRISYAILINADGRPRGAKRNAPMRPSARSALPPSTDIVSATRHVRKVPTGDIAVFYVAESPSQSNCGM